MKRLACIAAILLFASTLVVAADRDVKTVTRAIESHYGVKHHGLPWIARIAMKPALWGSGTKLDLAMFENLPDLTKSNGLEVDGLMSSSLGSEWSRFIRVESRKTGERAVIYVRNVGDKLEMMITSIEPDEAVVLKLRVKPEEMQKWMDDPEEMAIHRNHSEDAARQASTQQKSRTTKDGFVKTGTE
jgi:hypothetical protein